MMFIPSKVINKKKTNEILFMFHCLRNLINNTVSMVVITMIKNAYSELIDLHNKHKSVKPIS